MQHGLAIAIDEVFKRHADLGVLVIPVVDERHVNSQQHRHSNRSV